MSNSRLRRHAAYHKPDCDKRKMSPFNPVGSVRDSKNLEITKRGDDQLRAPRGKQRHGNRRQQDAGDARQDHPHPRRNTTMQMSGCVKRDAGHGGIGKAGHRKAQFVGFAMA